MNVSRPNHSVWRAEVVRVEGTVQNASTPLNEHRDHIPARTSALTGILYG